MSLTARRYAEALLKLEDTSGGADELRAELKAAAGAYASERDFRDFLLSPENTLADKKRALKDVFSGSVGQNTLNFLLLLLDKNRMKYLPEIAAEYASLSDERKNILHISIASAFPLDRGREEAICAKFASLCHAKSVKADVSSDPSLLGGVRVVACGRLYDGTIKGKISELQSVLGITPGRPTGEMR